MTCTLTIMLFVAAGLVSGASGEQTPPEYSTGGRFEAALDQSLQATWKNVGLRRMLERLSEAKGVAVLLDGRVDPTKPMDFDVDGDPLRSVFNRIAGKRGARVSFVTEANTVYIGPAAATERLRTLIALRAEEAGDAANGLSSSRRSQLADRKSIRWDDLETPAGVLKQIADRWRLEIVGLERVPHDLWAGATLPDVTSWAALTLVLNPFDLTFEWTEGGDAVRIVAVPNVVAIKRSHRPPRGRNARDVAKLWKNEFAGVAAVVERGRVVVTGTVEQHEAIEGTLHPGALRRDVVASETDDVVPLSRRKFTIRFRNAPARAVIEKLKQSDVEFEYDANAFEDAGVDFEKRISADLKDATAEKLLDAIFDPLGVEYEIDGAAVRLFLRKKGSGTIY